VNRKKRKKEHICGANQKKSKNWPKWGAYKISRLYEGGLATKRASIRGGPYGERSSRRFKTSTRKKTTVACGVPLPKCLTTRQKTKNREGGRGKKTWPNAKIPPMTNGRIGEKRRGGAGQVYRVTTGEVLREGEGERIQTNAFTIQHMKKQREGQPLMMKRRKMVTV